MSKLYVSGQPICPEHPRRSCLRNRASATLGGASALCERFTSFSCHLSSYTTPTSKGNPRKELCVCHTPGSSVVVDSEYLHRQTHLSILQNEDTAVAVTLKDTICTWLFVPSHCQDHCLPRAMRFYSASMSASSHPHYHG